MFQRKHSHHLARYIELTTFAKRKRGDSLGGASRPSKQPKINAGATVTSCQASQAKVDRLILGYLTEGLLPLSTVELPGIKDLIVGLQPNHTMLCRATVKMRFDEMVCNERQHPGYLASSLLRGDNHRLLDGSQTILHRSDRRR